MLDLWRLTIMNEKQYNYFIGLTLIKLSLSVKKKNAIT